MITIEQFTDMLDELASELPEAFYDELNLGINISGDAKLHEMARDNDLYIQGEYFRTQMGRGITIYYGSFEKLHGDLDEQQLKTELRSVLRHEFRHHMEYRAGENGLEIEDEKQLEYYLRD